MEPQQLCLCYSLLLRFVRTKLIPSDSYIGDPGLQGLRKDLFGKVRRRPGTTGLGRSEPAALDFLGAFIWPLGERRTVCSVHRAEGGDCDQVGQICHVSQHSAPEQLMRTNTRGYRSGSTLLFSISNFYSTTVVVGSGGVEHRHHSSLLILTCRWQTYTKICDASNEACYRIDSRCGTRWTTSAPSTPTN